MNFMREAASAAREGVERGDGGPFGAVVVKDGRIVARACNRVVANRDPTAHAEILAIREACRALGTFDLSGCEIHATCEPCPMCLAAIHWARLDRVVYALSRHDAAALGFDDARMYEGIDIPTDHVKCPEAAEVFRLWTGPPY